MPEYEPTVADLIAALLKLPQDAKVKCRREYDCGYAMSTEYAPVDIEYGVVLFDYTDDESRAKYPTMAGKKFVCIDA